MKENVGGIDRALRFALGVPLTVLGWRARGSFTGGLSLLTGFALLESGITRVCPVNYLMRMDTSYLERKPARPILPDLGLRGRSDKLERPVRDAPREAPREPVRATATVPPGGPAQPAHTMGAPMSVREEI